MIGLFTADGKQLFQGAESMTVQVNPTSKVAQHPLEDGTSVVDHRVILATEAHVILICHGDKYIDTYNEVRQVFHSGELLTLFTAVGVRENMYIATMPHDETPDMLGAVPIALRLVEAQFFKAQGQAINTKKVKDPKNSGTAKRGEQAPKKVERSSILFKVTQ